MTREERLLVVGGLAGAAWWLYQSSRGLTITGAPATQTMLPTPTVGTLSNVTPSYTTSTAATNVFSSIGSAFAGILGRVINKGPGNAPIQQPRTAVGSNANGIPGQASPNGLSDYYLAAANAVTANPNPNPGIFLSYSDPSSSIYWPPLDTPTDVVAPSNGVPLLGWTLDPSLVL